jgi:hypothetical protein
MLDISELIFKNLNSYLTEYWFYIILFYTGSQQTLLIINQIFFLNNNLITPITQLGLLNSLAIKHPILLMLFYLSCLKKKNSIKFFFGTSALIFGSYWAFLEFNWGGFWSFDIIETTLLFSLFLFIYIEHQLFYIKQDINKQIKTIFLVLLIFFFLKFNNLPSIHNFITINPLYYFWLLVLLFLFFSKTCKNFFFLLLTFYVFHNYLKFYSFFIIMFIYIFWSFYINKLHVNCFLVILTLVFFVLLNQNWVLIYSQYNLFKFSINIDLIVLNNSFLEYFLIYRTDVKALIKPQTSFSLNNYYFNYNNTNII